MSDPQKPSRLGEILRRIAARPGAEERIAVDVERMNAELAGDIAIDLALDLNTEDETGLPWGLLNEASDRDRITPGAFIVVGDRSAQAVAQVVDIVDGWIVHVRPLRGLVSEHRYLLANPQ